MTRASIDLRDARTAQAHELLLDQLRALTTGDQWLSMLELSRRFHTYSARNVLLLLAQGARGRVAGYRTWQTIPARDGGNCQVRKGAKSLTVLAPITRPRDEINHTTGETTTRRVLVGFKGVRVFDEAALVTPPANPEVMPELLRGESPQHLWHALADQVRAAGFTLHDGDCSPANGRTDWLARTVTVRPDLEPAQRTKTLAHELAHVRLHDPTNDQAQRSSRSRMEVEAESVAYLVCAHTGIDATQYTLPYVAHWADGDVELVQSTAERVIDTARVITDTLERDLTPEVVVPLQVTAPLAATAALEVEAPDPVDTVGPRHEHGDATTRGPERRAHLHVVPDDDALADVRASVEARAAQILSHLADNPHAWGADPEQHAAIRDAARAMSLPATPEVATARERLGRLLRHPAPPPKPDLGPSPDLGPAPGAA
jgi:hypothetical protein